MKQGTFVIKLTMFLLFAVVVIYFIGAAVRSFSHPYQTVLAYAYTLDDSAAADGWLIRTEQALTSPGGIVSCQMDEGDKAGKGQTVAVVYEDASSAERQQQLQTLSEQLEQLDYALQDDTTVAAGTTEDTQILSSMADLKQCAGGSWSSLYEDAQTYKCRVLRWEYTHTDDGQTAIWNATSQLEQQMTSLQSSSSSAVAVVAPVSGVFSGETDGYESVFTPAVLTDLSVSSLRALGSQSASPESNAFGKLVTDSTWYYAALMDEDAAARLTEGKKYTVRFDELADDLTLQAESVSETDGGKAVVVFSSTRDLSETIQLRKESSQVIFSTETGIRIPKNALRVLDDGTQGVYAISGAQAEFRPVTVLADGEDFYVVLPNPSSDTDKRILRTGDEILVSAVELYDGKVVVN